MDAIDYWSMNTRSMLLTGYRAHEAIVQVFGQDIVTIRCYRQTVGWSSVQSGFLGQDETSEVCFANLTRLKRVVL